MSFNTIEEYIKIFQERKLKNKNPNPYNVFIEVNSSTIYNNLKIKLGVRPKIGDLRREFKNSWDILSPNDKSNYEEAALSLGYISPSSILKRNNTINSNSLIEKLKVIRDLRKTKNHI